MVHRTRINYREVARAHRLPQDLYEDQFTHLLSQTIIDPSITTYLAEGMERAQEAEAKVRELEEWLEDPANAERYGEDTPTAPGFYLDRAKRTASIVKNFILQYGIIEDFDFDSLEPPTGESEQ